MYTGRYLAHSVACLLYNYSSHGRLRVSAALIILVLRALAVHKLVEVEWIFMGWFVLLWIFLIVDDDAMIQGLVECISAASIGIFILVYNINRVRRNISIFKSHKDSTKYSISFNRYQQIKREASTSSTIKWNTFNLLQYNIRNQTHSLKKTIQSFEISVRPILRENSLLRFILL
jgi:hypothetical protein